MGANFAQDFAFSDKTLKEHIEELTNVNEVLAGLHGRTFRWRADSPASLVVPGAKIDSKSQKFIGFIAQDVAKVSPGSVSKTADGWLTVDYVTIVPYLTEALKSHMKELEKVKAEAEQLEKLRVSIAALGAALKRQVSSSSPPTKGSDKDSRKNPQPFYKALLHKLSRKPVLITAPIVLLIIAAIVVACVIAIPRTDPPAGPRPVPPQLANSSTPRNYLTDGGFENPDTWSGNGTILSYNTSTYPPGPLMKQLAPFQTGGLFAFLSSTNGSSLFVQSQNTPISGWAIMNLTVQAFIPTRTRKRAVADFPAGGAVQPNVRLEVYKWFGTPNRTLSCSASARATISMNSWQLISATLNCLLAPNDTLVISLSSQVFDIVYDDVKLLLLDQYSYIPRPPLFGSSGAVELRYDITRTSSGAFTTAIVPLADGSYMMAVAQQPGLYFDVGVVKVNSPASWNQSYGLQGLGAFPYLRQMNPYRNWFHMDQQNRTVLVGHRSTGSLGRELTLVARLDRDGQVDQTFGNSGVVQLYFGTEGPEQGLTAATLTDGTIIVVSEVVVNGKAGFAVAKLSPSGYIDRSFSYGVAIWTSNATMPQALFAAVLPSGKIFLAFGLISTDKMYTLDESGDYWSSTGVPVEVAEFHELNYTYTYELKFMRPFAVRPQNSFFI